MPSNIIKILFTLLLCISFSFIGHTQITERIKTRAKNRTNRRAEQKVDDAVDKTLDKFEGLFRKKDDAQKHEESETTYQEDSDNEMTDEEIQQSVFLSGLSRSGNFEPYENPVRMSMSIDITTVNKRGKSDEIKIDYTFDTWATAMELDTDGNHIRMLLDNKEGSQTMITEDNGKVQAIKMRQQAINFDNFVPDESEFTITETGKTRTIDGYSCKEYLIEHEDGTTNSWITQDIDLDMTSVTKAFSAQIGGQKNMPTQNFYNLEGFPVEAITVSKNGKETTTIHYYNIQTGDNINMDVFNIDGIEVMSLGF